MRVLKPPSSWRELEKFLWAGSFDRGRNEYRPRVAFRGVGKQYPDMRTGIQRIAGKKKTSQQLNWRERRVVDTFATYAREHLPERFTDWDVLLLGQHYRLPTRLLDWTSSPYVALFFATENDEELRKDGIVWCVKRHETLRALPAALKSIRRPNDGTVFTVDDMRRCFRHGLAAFDEQCPDKSLIWFEPPSVSPRMVGQYALFSMMSGVHSQQHEWFANHQPSWHWGVPIPARLKLEIRQRLWVMNVNDRTVYSGLDGIAKWLRAYYSV